MGLENLTVRADLKKQYDNYIQEYEDLLKDCPSSFEPKAKGNTIEDVLNQKLETSKVVKEKSNEIIDWKKEKAKAMIDSHTDNSFEATYKELHRIEVKTAKIRNTLMIVFMCVTAMLFAFFFSLFSVAKSNNVGYMIVWILMLALFIAEVLTFVGEWIRHHYTPNPLELIQKVFFYRVELLNGDTKNDK